MFSTSGKFQNSKETQKKKTFSCQLEAKRTTEPDFPFRSHLWFHLVLQFVTEKSLFIIESPWNGESDEGWEMFDMTFQIHS